MSIEAVGVNPKTAEVREVFDIGRQIVNFIGPEGSGKSTIAKRLALESGKPYLAVGDILRELAANDPGPLGDECREMFAQHRYFKDREMLLDIYAERFKRNDLEQGFILDGSLRGVIEVAGFQLALDRADRTMPVVVVRLRIPGWMGIQRLSIDPKARSREDDDADAVLSRLSKFYNRLGERVSLIQKQPNWKFIPIDATGTAETTFGKVRSALSR